MKTSKLKKKAARVYYGFLAAMCLLLLVFIPVGIETKLLGKPWWIWVPLLAYMLMVSLKLWRST